MKRRHLEATASYNHAADDENSALDSINRSNSEDVHRYQILPDTKNSSPDEIGKREITVALNDWGDGKKDNNLQRGYHMTKTQKTEEIVN